VNFFVILAIFAEKPLAALADICGNLAGSKARQYLLIAINHVDFFIEKKPMSEKEALLLRKGIF